jgi:hypothetical protein
MWCGLPHPAPGDTRPVPIRLHDGEPPAGPWRVEPLAALVGRLAPAAPHPPRRARIIAVDGRSAAGKTTLAERIAGTSPRSTVVHTDDIAWYQAVIDWAYLLAGDVLEPVRRGEAVSYRPPEWDRRNRAGSIEIDASCELLVVEGVAAGRAELAHLYDAIVWIQSDHVDAKTRGIARDVARGDTKILEHWESWQLEEVPHFAQDRPWTRADAIVAGTPDLPHDPDTEIVVAPRIG